MDLMSEMKSTSGLAQLLTCKTKFQPQNPAKSVWNKQQTIRCVSVNYISKQERWKGKQMIFPPL